MWIVRLALRNPYSVAVLSMVILILGILSIASMIVDVFPVIDLPVVGVIWNFPGLSAEEVEHRIVTITERAFSTTVSGISRIESQSISGTGNIRVYFEPGTPIGSAIAQLSATSQTIVRILPPGMTPPLVFPFNASNVPVAQLTISSSTLPEQDLFDYGLNFIRVQLFTIPGLATPAPYGGKFREIVVDVDPSLASSKGVSIQDVLTTLQSSNIILPAGDTRIGAIDYNVLMNASPLKVDEFNSMPIKIIGTRPVLLGDVSHISDSYADQTNIARINGKRSTFLNILKKAQASTLTVLDALRAKLPNIQASAPKGMNINIDFDQSVFVKASVNSVIREAMLAAILVSLMVLVFLGNWRSVLIVSTSIPLSILVGFIGLKLTGETINIMTLGGLSLAIGMLVDDATVEVENINRNLPTSSSKMVGILRSASQIALPAIVSTLAICIVFCPIALLSGTAKFLFTPMAEAVVFSMLASYLLSRTLVPVLSHVLLKEPVKNQEEQKSRWSHGFDKRFDQFKHYYGRVLEVFLENKIFVITLFAVFFFVSLWIPLSVIGRDFFPAADAGLMKFHFRAPTGTRIEETEKLVEQVEERVRKIIPQDELRTINANIGVPTFYNLAFVPSDNVGPMDAEFLVALGEKHRPTIEYVRKIREDLGHGFPGAVVYFQSADIVNQVLNFGLTSPIDVQIQSKDIYLAYEYARKLRDRMRLIPGAADVAIKQVFDYPSVRVNIDRVRAAEMGLSVKDVATNMLASLSSSVLSTPSFYINPANGVNYSVVAKVPLAKIESISDLNSVPMTPLNQSPLQQAGQSPSEPSLIPPGAPASVLGNISSIESLTVPNQVSHVDVQRIVNVTANVDHRDLGSIVSGISDEIEKLGKLPLGTEIRIRGQNEVMKESFTKLGLGMFLAIALVYMLMVTLFQSWIDPFIIMAAVPGALIGIFWMLAVTGTSINVVSLMGSIMAIGIAVSNSNLLVAFANDIRVEREMSSDEAALEAAKTRLRPVIMTALAMILGMLPMALSLGEGGEQNAPLGKAVIGGLLVATVTTLIIVPLAYSILRKDLPTKYLLHENFKNHLKAYDEEEKNAERVKIQA